MRQPRLRNSANDNTPLRRRDSSALNTVRVLRHNKTAMPSTSPNAGNKSKVELILTWGIPLLGALMAAFAVFLRTPANALLWPSSMMGLLLLWTTLRSDPHTRLRNISSLMLIGAVTLSVGGLFALNEITLIGVEFALLVSTFSLLLGWVISSRPAIMLSVISAIVYLLGLFPELGLLTGIIDGIPKIGMGFIPFLLLGQAFLAQHLRSYMITALTICGVLIWVLAVAKNLPLHALAGLCFAIAAAHYCLGKTCEVVKIFGARLHTVFALIVGLASALYIQSLWMQFDSEVTQGIWSASSVWWGTIALSMSIILISSLIRFKTSQISLPGIFILTLGVLVLPLTMAKPELIEAIFYQIPGFDAYPSLGFIIGAVIIASCLVWIGNGLKHGWLLNVLIGTVAIGLEAIILYQPNHFSMEFGVIFITSLIFALCIGGLIAGTTSDQTESTLNYA